MSPSENRYCVSCTEGRDLNDEHIFKDDLICVVDGHSDIANGPMLSTGVVQHQVHGRNKDAVSASSMIFIFVCRPARQNVWCV